MGADFLFGCVVVRDNKNLNRLRERLIDECRCLTIADLTDGDKTALSFEYDLDITEDNWSDIRDGIVNNIEDTFYIISQGSREISCLAFKGYNIYLTGGMSWGDSPTDAFDVFNRFDLMPSCLQKFLV